jgi:hypothetical protein
LVRPFLSKRKNYQISDYTKQVIFLHILFFGFLEIFFGFWVFGNNKGDEGVLARAFFLNPLVYDLDR